MQIVSDKGCRENQNTNFTFNNFFFWKSYRLRDNAKKYGKARVATDDNTTRCTRNTCWITKDKDIHS